MLNTFFIREIQVNKNINGRFVSNVKQINSHALCDEGCFMSCEVERQDVRVIGKKNSQIYVEKKFYSFVFVSKIKDQALRSTVVRAEPSRGIN